MMNSTSDNLIFKISQILAKFVSKGDTLIVGVSGGPDSTALLNILPEVFGDLVNIVVAHVNHGIRGKAADEDEEFVRKMAEKLGFKFEVKRVNLAGKKGVEEEGRRVRKEFFAELLAKHKAKFILTAHTQNDAAETIVFNFIRGCGPGGLAGMKMKNGAYLKPLLDVKKAELISFLRERKIKFRKDETNKDTKLSRNFIRRKIIPMMEKLNPSFGRTVTRNAEIFDGIDAFLKDEARKFIGTEKEFSTKEFAKMPEILQKEIIQTAFANATNENYRLPALKVGQVINLISRNIGRKHVGINKKVSFHIEKGLIVVKR